MAEGVKKKPRGRPFQPGNQFAKNKRKPEALPGLPADVLPDEREAMRRLWERGISGKQGSTTALKSYIEFAIGKANARPPAPKTPIDSLSRETIERMTAIAEKLVTRSISLTLEYAEEVGKFVASFSPEERAARGLSSTSAHALECAVRDTKVRLETQPEPQSDSSGFKAFEPPQRPKAPEQSSPDAERTVLMRQPRTVIENPDPLRDHTELPKL